MRCWPASSASKWLMRELTDDANLLFTCRRRQGRFSLRGQDRDN